MISKANVAEKAFMPASIELAGPTWPIIVIIHDPESCIMARQGKEKEN